VATALPLAVEARLTRAGQHVVALQTMLEAYAARPPWRVSRRPSEPPRVIERAELVEQPPIEAAMLVSDAVHQARAALDNLVNALRNGGPAPKVCFPVHADAAEFDRHARDELNGVPDWARDAIRDLQPFSMTSHWKVAGEPLAYLHELARVDRHRVPPLHAGVVWPEYATGNAASGIEPRVNPAGGWAEWEYVPSEVGRTAFEVKIHFGPEGGQPPDVEVVDWTSYLVRSTAYAIELILRSAAMR